VQVLTVAVSRLEIAECSRLEVMPAGNKRSLRELPRQERRQVLVALDGPPGRPKPVLDVDVAAFPQRVAAGMAAEHHDGTPGERLYRGLDLVAARRTLQGGPEDGPGCCNPGSRPERLQQADALGGSVRGRLARLIRPLLSGATN